MSLIRLSGAQPEIVSRVYAYPDLPASLRGFRVVFLTDVHLGCFFSLRALRRLARTVRDLRPDLLLLGGDNAESERLQRVFFEEMRAADAKYGALCVPGNNDWECFGGDYAEMRRVAAINGTRMLVNESAAIDFADGRLLVCGCDDVKYGHPVPAALPAKKRRGDFIALVSHSPFALHMLLDGSVAAPDLALCGHTHGGQIVLGRFSPYACKSARRKMDAPYFRVTGEHAFGGMRLVVSNGVGASLVPLRIGAPPQLYVIELTRPD